MITRSRLQDRTGDDKGGNDMMKDRDKVSQVYWTSDRKWAFQRIGNSYNVYNQDGDYEKSFTSFWKMCEWIRTCQER